MEKTNKYAINIETSLSFEEAISKVTDLLKEEGFGILTEIDVKATLKKKLDYDFKPYRILGACNPPFARKAIEADHNIGVLLPCNVVIWDEGSHRVISAMEPEIMAQLTDAGDIKQVACEVSSRIHRVMDKMKTATV